MTARRKPESCEPPQEVPEPAGPSVLPYARPYWDDAEAAALTSVLESGMWTNGAHVAAFERTLSGITGAPTITLSSGTAALFALLHVLGRRTEGPGLLVTPTLNFAAGAASAKLLGWDVAICDVLPHDLTLDPADLDKLLEGVHRDYARIVVLPVHYAGHTCDMPRITEVCARYGADLVEDACHAVGATYTDTSIPVGSWPQSLAAVYSFHPTKPIASGEGGAVATGDVRLLEELRLTRNHEMTPVGELTHDHAPWPYTVRVPGMNLRLSEFNAAVGNVQAARAEESRRERARLAGLYHEALADMPAVRTVPLRRREGSAHHLFPVVFALDELQMSRKSLLAAFHDRGIRCQVHYTPLHLLPAFADSVQGSPDRFPEANALFPGLLSLPLWRGMSDADVERVTELVSSVVRHPQRHQAS
ncbi:DegT/DnrJ/EryC1/StrS family aminotransferase [Streptomyces clavifer]|uniref:DegT/DnrJ/EryC1/StrS family aminotransferase n=1 Tax=Streptomyces clavifer TaxID=68188 RepID=UPI00369AFD7C